MSRGLKLLLSVVIGHPLGRMMFMVHATFDCEVQIKIKVFHLRSLEYMDSHPSDSLPTNYFWDRDSGQVNKILYFMANVTAIIMSLTQSQLENFSSCPLVKESSC